jgi:hypothetical protein
VCLRASLLALVVILPSYADAQELVPSTHSVAEWMRPISSSANQLQARPMHHCCNIKRAIIGGAIGAALGVGVGTSLCDVEDCTRISVSWALLLGGLGATVGAFTDSRQGVPPGQPQRVRVSGLVTPRVRAGTVSVRF